MNKIKSEKKNLKQAKGKKTPATKKTKQDNEKTVFVRISGTEMKKVKIKLAKRDMTISEWIREKIDEL